MSRTKQNDGLANARWRWRSIALKAIAPGFFIDARNRLYFSVQQFLACAGFPDTPEARAMVMREIRKVLAGLPFIEVRGRLHLWMVARRRKRKRL
ncbi:MAG TPA: hypothetical protein VNW97_15305 [Candidatus Saccharimonadales bacterium]|jgi:hypothetical protein|nr:hypothetical protein [Candidatus Saccharimonadales bacterium]